MVILWQENVKRELEVELTKRVTTPSQRFVKDCSTELRLGQKGVELANGQLDIRKAQLLARAYKKRGGGYK